MLLFIGMKQKYMEWQVVVFYHLFIYLFIVVGDQVIKKGVLGSYWPVYLRHIRVPVPSQDLYF